MKIFKPRIQNKLIAAFIFVAVVPMILSTWIVVHINTTRLEQEIELKIKEASDFSISLIERYKIYAESLVKYLLEEGDLRRDFAVWQETENPIIRAYRSPFKQTLIGLWVPGYLEGINYAEQGINIAEVSGGEQREGEIIRENDEYSMLRTVLEVDFENTKTLLAGVIMPVLIGNKVGNFIAGFELGESFAQDIEKYTPGTIVRIYRDVGNNLPQEQLSLRHIQLSEAAQVRIFHEQERFYDSNTNYKNEPFRAMYSPLIGRNGKLVGVIFVGIPQSYTWEAAVKTWRFFPILIGLCVLMAGTLAYTVARRIARPIRMVAKGARAVANGNLDQYIPVNGADEIGNLSFSFNLMTEKLRHLRELEEELRRKDRLAALGELSAGVAHEIRNPLGIIRSSAQVLRSRFKESEKERELSDFIVGEVDRLNKVVTDLLEFARPRQPHRQKVRLPELVEEVLLLLEEKIKATGIKVKKDYDLTLPQVAVDRQLLSQVFVNLIINAIEANSTELLITTASGVEEIGYSDGKGSVVIDFRDNGCGIMDGNVAKVFNPFFSTKDEGTGLGLAITHKIVDSHGGKIIVDSELGKGSVFRVILPVGWFDD